LPCVTNMCDTRKCDTYPPSQRWVRLHKKRMCVCRLRVTQVCHTYYVRVVCVSQCVAVCCSVVQSGAVCTLERVPSSLRTLSPTKRDIHAGVRESRGMRNIFSRHRCLNLPEVLGDPGGPPHPPQTSCEKTLFSNFGAKIQIYGAKFKCLASSR